MKKQTLIILPILGLLLGSFAFFGAQKENKYTPVSAFATDMDNIAVEAGEELDTEHAVYDDFSSGLSTSMWAISKKAWGNGDVSYNSGVIPENVFYNSVDKTVVFRALGDYYKDNDVNYDLHHTYGYAHDSSTGNGRVYSKDGTRTGGCIKTKDVYGPGRFEARFKAAPVEGICNAFWTFNYGTSGNANYNEMDFEFPTYLSKEPKGAENDLYFNRIICTTYKTEGNYKSQRVTNSVYLNDNQYHTYCLEWYYSNNTKKVKWFIDGVQIASWDNATQISDNVGRVTLGVWIPGRSDFCGIPNFDKAYMELDYFKYTPFKNQTYVTTSDVLDNYTDTFGTITSTPKSEFVPQGDFKYGLPEFMNATGDVAASKSYDYAGSNNSYGIKISGENGEGVSTLEYTNPNVRGIEKLELSFKYKGYGSARAYADTTSILATGTLASRNEWTEFKQVLDIPAGMKTITIDLDSESNDFGFFVDDVSLAYPEEEQQPIETNNSSDYSFYTQNNGQTSENSNAEREIAPDLNNEHLWRFSYCKYYTKNSIKSISMKPSNAVMNSSSGDYYYPFKQALADASLYSTGDKLSFAAMKFDIDYFKDVEFILNSYSGVSERKITILYSLNQGESWYVHSTTDCSNITKETAPFQYKLRIVASDYLKGKTIRFAFVGNEGTGSSEEKGYGYLLLGVIVNNYQNFKDKLDTEICNADSDTQYFLAHQYFRLTSAEKVLLETEQMTNYNQSYADGYAYLLEYWNGGGLNVKITNSISMKKETTTIIVVAVAIVTMLGIGLLLIKKKTNQ